MESSNGEGGLVLVTGGSGFLGSWCVIEALRRGYSVRTAVRDLEREPDVRAAVARGVDAGDRLAVVSADLGHDAGWEEAVEGCDHVLHVASPFTLEQPRDPNEMIEPARDGTLRVLRRALDAGAKRIVVTSSVAAIMPEVGTTPARPLNEEDWADPEDERLSPYARSKTIAEIAAWDAVRDRGVEEKLAVVNPGAIIGPLLSEDRSPSLQLIERLLGGSPGIPRIGFSIVDVRDVADLELTAMTSPQAGGERFIAAGPFKWMEEIAQVLRSRLGERASKVPKRSVPNAMVKLLAIFDRDLRTVARQLDREVRFSNEKARSALGWQPRPVEESIVDTAESLIREGVVKTG